MHGQSRALKGLNAAQQEAVRSTEGPSLIIAGAGSGKTRALTHRIAYLLEQGVRPEQILALTFTNKAAGEMRERVYTLIGQQGDGSETYKPFIGTFHSLGARILRAHAPLVGRAPSFTIYDEHDTRALLKKLAGGEGNASPVRPGAARARISRLKNDLVSADAALKAAQNPRETYVAQLYEAYERALQGANAVDFDDLLLLSVALFDGHPQILSRYQQQFRYILVDEYQDTNRTQYALLARLAASHRNLCVVGDDWQAIYGWRGADFTNILRFEKDWPDARVFFLEENYRSTQHILSAAQAVIEKNQFRTAKNLWTRNGDGEKVRIITAQNEYDEARLILDRAEHLGAARAKIAVLYRTNAQSRAFEEQCVARGIPYRVVGGIRFFDRKEIKDLVAYLRLIANRNDAVALRRAANVPARGIGPRTVEKIIAGAEAGERARRFTVLLETFAEKIETMAFPRFVETLIDRIEYESYLRDGSEQGEERWENVQELLRLCQKFADLPGTRALSSFLEEAALLSSADEGTAGEDRLTLMTLHAAKGLEFETVFISGCEEGILPHERSMLSLPELEEERRLFYVGLTRARRGAYLSYCTHRSLLGARARSLPSRFLSDIPEELYELYTPEALETIDIEQ
jgi:DNA helicase-2/ATP-dependent DNA helicase PcrA